MLPTGRLSPGAVPLGFAARGGTGSARIGAAAWTFSPVMGVPSLQVPMYRFSGVFPSAYSHSRPVLAQLRSASQEMNIKLAEVARQVVEHHNKV